MNFLWKFFSSALLFFYILFKLGLCQCIGKSLCRMCWGACEMYWFALEDITCFLWHKLLNTKRVNRRRRRHRRRFRDIERGYDYSSSDETETDFFGDNSGQSIRHNTRATRFHGSFRGKSRNHRKSKSRDVSVHVSGGSYRLRSARRLQLSKVRNVELRKVKTFKRRRLKWWIKIAVRLR